MSYKLLEAIMIAGVITGTARGGPPAIFTDKGELSAFNQSEGEFFEGIETFEERNLSRKAVSGLC